LNKERSAAGFTLIEVLVALAILGLALGVIMTSFANGTRGIASAAAASEALAVARSLLSVQEARPALVDGDETGTTADGFAWRVRTSPWGTPDDARMPLVGGYRIDILVAKDGRNTALATLLPGPAPNGN